MNYQKTLIYTKHYRLFILLPLFLLVLQVLLPPHASAQSAATEQSTAQGIQSIPGMPAVRLTTNADGSQEYSVSIQILAIMTALTFLPALLLMMTSFTRIIIVFAILRQALGLQQSPSNQILLGMTLFLTIFIMAPVFQKVNEQALQPYLNQEIGSKEVLDRSKKPFHDFMLSQTRESDLKLFMDIANVGTLNGPEEVPITVLIPSFITSELKTAFQIGFILFISFFVIGFA